MKASTTPTPRLPNLPTYIEHGNLRFLIMDAPSDRNLDLYVQEMEKHSVTDVVRACEPTYEKQSLEKREISVHDWPFNDGEAPPESIVTDWLNLVEARLVAPLEQKSGKDKVPGANPTDETKKERPTIAVHCVAGLGRAPLLVSMALIEFGGMQPLDSVIFIRERRRGAINARQLKFIEGYKRRKKNRRGAGEGGRCRIM